MTHDQINKLLDALQFYAAAVKYNVGTDGRGLGRRSDAKQSIIELDEGARAREALEGLDTESIKSFSREGKV